VVELLLVFGLLSAIVGATAVVALSPWYYLFGGGLILVAAGMLVGVPAGFFYHLELYRILRPREQLRRGWWLNPTSLHAGLHADELRRLRPWFTVGAAGFAAAILGCLLTGVGAWRS
jgi:hypothetical protein